MLKKYDSIEYEVVFPFIQKTLPKEQWTHEAHLVTAIWHLLNYGYLEALCYMRARIIEYNVASGGANTISSGYHETLTQFYLKEIDFYLKYRENVNQSFNEICEDFLKTEYATKEYPLQFYTKERLQSLKARSKWVKPDQPFKQKNEKNEKSTYLPVS
jgi:hypothetical protein